MTNTDDWTRFCEMLKDKGFYQEFGSGSPFVTDDGQFYDPVTGDYMLNASSKIINVGVWRDWLPVGEFNPPPF